MRNEILNTLSKELDTRDKRYMFLKLNFPNTVSMINLEGAAIGCSFEIYDEIRKHNKLEKLVELLNTHFNANITYQN